MKQKKILVAALALALVAASGVSALAASPTVKNSTDAFISTWGDVKIEAVKITEGGPVDFKDLAVVELSEVELADFNFKDLIEFELSPVSGGEIKFEAIELLEGELADFREMPAISGETITINLVAAP